MKRKSENISIIDSGLTIDGTISCKGKLIIKGTVKGNLEGETVVIADEGSLYADAAVESVTIGGLFEGSIQASKELIVLSSGKCAGKVVCKDLVVEAGGTLNAEVTCTAGQEEAAGDRKAKIKALEL
ncbi:MAG: polymer-forming cytoskeletal protein [Desulfobacterales bacterium]|nr:polymer-forming cytoskeletal protein [Desulfobacterales bacterium]